MLANAEVIGLLGLVDLSTHMPHTTPPQLKIHTSPLSAPAPRQLIDNDQGTRELSCDEMS